jgi:hypothetical protein
MPGTNNPFTNTAKILTEKGAGHFQKYINEHVKDTQVNITLGQIIQSTQYFAFEEGKKAGKNELRNDLKELLEIEERDFFDTNGDM